jgi:hypothetical protein
MMVAAQTSRMLLLVLCAAACSPDWVCGIFSWVGELVDWAIAELVKKMDIEGVDSLEDLFIKALEEFGVPVSAAPSANGTCSTGLQHLQHLQHKHAQA